MNVAVSRDDAVAAVGVAGDREFDTACDRIPAHHCVATGVNGPVHGAHLTRPSDPPERSALPDPLETVDGDAAETAEERRNTRRPELRQHFRHYVYSYLRTNR